MCLQKLTLFSNAKEDIIIVEYIEGPYITLNEPKKVVMRIMENGLGIHQLKPLICMMARLCGKTFIPRTLRNQVL